MRNWTCQVRRNVLLAALMLGLIRLNVTDGFAAEQVERGLIVTFSSLNGDSAEATDTTVVPNVWLYVPVGKAPSPFLPAGKFSADWTGFISSEIRDNYTFQAELNGDLKLEINGAVVWETRANGTMTGQSKPVRLSKGTNAWKVHFTSSGEGDAFVRLQWASREFPPEPIALDALTHRSTSELAKADQLRLGRELFIESRCAKCHAGRATERAVPELGMDAPSFEGIGSCRNYDWMTRWVADPQSLRPTARMPKLFHGAQAAKDAEAVAAFLTSLKSDSVTREATEPGAGLAEAGKRAFETLHCIACHNTPGTSEHDPQKISFGQVREKFALGALNNFLRKPEEHYVWIRMPNFKLTAEEAAQLAAFLGSSADKPKDGPPPTDRMTLERGRQLVQSSGCLKCHSLKLEDRCSTRPLADLSADKWQQGCMADKPSGDSGAPWFSFTQLEREALRAFGASDRESLARDVPAEFAERQTRNLHCAECHGKFEGFPPMDILGGKLKPEWMKAFIAGEVSDKPRPWIGARMPAFPGYAERLATGLAALHGFPAHTPGEPPVDSEAARIGRTLISVNGGFFCVSCHAVGSVAAMQVFESNGLNLARTGARLQKSYYRRWVRNPQRIDRATKMPIYFDAEGKSPLTDFYDGDAEKQIEAIWQYIRMGERMPPPLKAP
jgi:mono/diheme cytochrome c family protein